MKVRLIFIYNYIYLRHGELADTYVDRVLLRLMLHIFDIDIKCSIINVRYHLVHTVSRYSISSIFFKTKNT